jgi:carbon-monoxide dehydrogenase medium subunit
MISHQFDYVQPTTVEQAIAELKNGNATLIAGGVSVVRELKRKNLTVERLVSLKKVSGLTDIRYAAEKFTVGAMVTYDALLYEKNIAQKCPLLYEALASYTDPQIRNQATIGGCIASLQSNLDLSAAALALDAHVITSSGSFLVGSRELAKDEIILAVEFPVAGQQFVSGYERIKHPATNLSICGVAVAAEIGSAGVIAGCHITLSGATPKVARLTSVENEMNGHKATPALIANAINALSISSLDLVSDLEGSPEYRKNLVLVIGEKVLARVFLSPNS